MAYRALDRLLDTTPPLLKGRRPFWRPTPPPCHRDVREPQWRWDLPLRAWRSTAPGPVRRCWSPSPHLAGAAVFRDDDTIRVLDCNAAYLAAASTVEVAHARLDRTRVIPFDAARPGYWQIEIFPWQVPSIWSPLGTGQMPARAWLTTPTVALLAKLVDEGFWPEVRVHDSWTTEHRCRLRNWTDLVSGHRREALATGDTDTYEQIKIGYSQAVTIMGVDRKSKIFRPDWSQHIRAQHAANMWRKAWGAWSVGCPVLASGTVDEFTVVARHLDALTERQQQGHRTPIRVDESGRSLGSFKTKHSMSAEEWVDRG